VISVFVFRLRMGPLALGTVFALFVLSSLGVAAFLLGRAHARYRREKKDEEE
jgi:hypothetical protein